MALKFTPPPLPIFVPKFPSQRTPSELRFSRWNNANAHKFLRRERAQKEIEDEIRRERRYQSASIIADNNNNNNHSESHRHVPITITDTTNETFKSIGTPSSPSRPSIPGKRSKYSKQTLRKTHRNTNFTSHPAFSRNDGINVAIEDRRSGGITVGERGIAYRIPNAPFEFQYSYTETPKVKPLALREAAYLPFGPATMPRPWTGRAPHPPSKKKLPEFDSFKLPPADKKGVKPVQAPGPFLKGMRPKYVVSREEILGAPLTEGETKELVQGCLRTRRQMNMGRDGLTHNMLDNIHAHWKRRRVCKIKCKGVCTVDLDNVCQQLEEKTGGKIIYKRGGVLFLFRGRNYNYKTRPQYPLMLWKPITPVYPRLVQQAPEGLTIEEAREMRKQGHKLPPICKLGKNGVYSDLVKHVREAFEECELVRINCQGMNGSDYRKIGAKLKDLVPCVLISFAFEHILMWRGRDWKSSFPKSETCCTEVKESEIDGPIANPPSSADSSVLQDQETSASCYSEEVEDISNSAYEEDQKFNFSSALSDTMQSNTPSSDDFSAFGDEETSALCDEISSTTVIAPSFISGREDSSSEGAKDVFHASNELESSAVVAMDSNTIGVYEPCALSTSLASNVTNMNESSSILDRTGRLNDVPEAVSIDSDHSSHLGPKSDGIITLEQDRLERSANLAASVSSTCTEGITLLLKEAIENGNAVVLDDASLNDNIIYGAAVSLAKAAPPGPVFRHQRPRKALVQNQNGAKQEDRNLEELVCISEKKIEKRSSRNQRIKDFKGVYTDSSPHGSLGVDELAKLLA